MKFKDTMVIGFGIDGQGHEMFVDDLEEMLDLIKQFFMEYEGGQIEISISPLA